MRVFLLIIYFIYIFFFLTDITRSPGFNDRNSGESVNRFKGNDMHI